MAQPINFPEANFTWKGTPASEGQEEVGDLITYIDEAQGLTLSCWEVSADELNAIIKSGHIWLHVWGQHPPVFVSGERPFNDLAENRNGNGK